MQPASWEGNRVLWSAEHIGAYATEVAGNYILDEQGICQAGYAMVDLQN